MSLLQARRNSPEILGVISISWIGELATVLFVVAVGLVLAVVVEREQRSRIRAEESIRRLALLDDIAASLNHLPDPRLFLRAVLDELIDALRLEAVAFVGVDESWPTVVREPNRERIEDSRRPGDDDWIVGIPQGEGLIVVPVAAGGELGKLVVSAGDVVLGGRDLELLASVAEEMRLALENARLDEIERTMGREHVQAVTRAQEEVSHGTESRFSRALCNLDGWAHRRLMRDRCNRFHTERCGIHVRIRKCRRCPGRHRLGTHGVGWGYPGHAGLLGDCRCRAFRCFQSVGPERRCHGLGGAVGLRHSRRAVRPR